MISEFFTIPVSINAQKHQINRSEDSFKFPLCQTLMQRNGTNLRFHFLAPRTLFLRTSTFNASCDKLRVATFEHNKREEKPSNYSYLLRPPINYTLMACSADPPTRIRSKVWRNLFPVLPPTTLKQGSREKVHSLSASQRSSYKISSLKLSIRPHICPQKRINPSARPFLRLKQFWYKNQSSKVLWEEPEPLQQLPCSRAGVLKIWTTFEY